MQFKRSWVWVLCLAAGIGVLCASCQGNNFPNRVAIDRIQSTPVQYPFSFVMMGDTRPPGLVNFAKLRSQILEIDPSPVFVIDIGDLVSNGYMIEYPYYLGSIDPFPLPFVSVIGNHELYAAQGHDNYAKLFGDEDFHFDYANCRFIALNDSNPGSYGVTDAQLAWLEDLLDDPTPADKFTFMHVPVPFKELVDGSSKADEILSGSRADPNWNAFKDLVEAYGVRIAAFGHIHDYRHMERNGVHYVVTGGGGAELEGPVIDDPPDYGIFHHFTQVTISADGNSRAEIVKKGEGTTPDDRYTIAFETTVIE
ncbi:metallophosphoesterase family protein [Thermodesulfobacteriota bacterium]